MRFGVGSSISKHGLPIQRKCMNCGLSVEDNGSVAWLRGFCSDDCFAEYMALLKKK